MKRVQAAAAARLRTVSVHLAQQPAVIDWTRHCVQKKKKIWLLSDVVLSYTKRIIYTIICFFYLMTNNLVFCDRSII